MKRELVFATRNQHKVEEISKMIGGDIKLLSLNDIGCQDEIPEDHDTLEANALQKANFVYEKYRINCFADDTGLEVDALQGRPGVYSARYSEDIFPLVEKEKRSEANIVKLLHEMENRPNRKASFRTVICLIENAQRKYFEGRVTGTLIFEKRGSLGFGYDPIFLPDGYTQTFAEMDLISKNQISHRARAFAGLVEYISQNRSVS
jgi:XTP/dITP diphosphohydrolase